MDGWFFVSGLNNENRTCFLARKFLSNMSNFPMGIHETCDLHEQKFVTRDLHEQKFGVWVDSPTLPNKRNHSLKCIFKRFRLLGNNFDFRRFAEFLRIYIMTCLSSEKIRRRFEEDSSSFFHAELNKIPASDPGKRSRQAILASDPSKLWIFFNF